MNDIHSWKFSLQTEMKSHVILFLLLFFSSKLVRSLDNCNTVEIEGMKGLSSELAQFQLNLDSEFVTPTDDQNSFVFDDSTNQFYKLTYGPVNIEIQSKPATQNMIRLKVIIAKAPDDEVRNVFKGNFLIKNFDVSSPVQFENAFCVVTGSFVDCTCCEDYQRANANIQQCRSYESSNQMDFSFSTFLENYGIIYASGTTWSVNDAPLVFFKFSAIEYPQPNPPIITIQRQNREPYNYETVSCEFSELMNIGCKVDLSWRTEQLSIKIQRGQYDTSDTVANFKIVNSQLKTDAECKDGSSPQAISYYWACPHGQTAPSTFRTNVFSCPNAPGFDKTKSVNGDTYTAAALYFESTTNINVGTQWSYIRLYYAKNNYILKYKKAEDTSVKPAYLNSMFIADLVLSYYEYRPLEYNTIQLNFVPDKSAVVFKNVFCLQEDTKRLLCVCCAEGVDDPFCTTQPIVDLHFHGVAGRLGSIRGSARSWVSQLGDLPKVNFLLNSFAPSFPKLSSDVYTMTGNAIPPIEHSGQCNANYLCSFDIHTNSQKLIFKMHDHVIMEIPIANNLIDLNTNDPVCHDVQSSSVDWKACMCPIGVEMSSSTCHLQQPKKCSSATPSAGQTVSTIRFTDPEFNGIPINGKVQRKYLTDISTGTPRYFTLTYEQIQGFATKRPSSPSAFLMNITVGDWQTTSQPSGTITGVIGFKVNSNDWFIFENAFCAVDHGTVECSCCELNTVDGLCATIELVSHVNFVFSTLIDAYGLITGSGVIRLDVQKNLMLEGHTLDAMFNAPFVIALSTSKSGTTKKLTECNDWATCQVQMTDDDLSADVILLQLKFQGLTTLSTLTTIKLDNKKIKVDDYQCVTYEDSRSQTSGCVCKSGQPKDSNCPSINSISCDDNKNVIVRSVDGLIISSPAVSIQTTSIFQKPAQETDVIYGYVQDANNNFYSIVYSSFTNTNSKDRFTMKLKLGPMTSTAPGNLIGQIELNFDLNNAGIIFAEAQCLQRNANKVDCACSFINIPRAEVTPMTKVIATTPSTVEEKNPCAEATKSSDFCDIDPKDDMNNTDLDQYANQTNEKIEEKIESGTMTADDLQVVSELLVKMADVKDASTEQRKSVLSVVNSALNVQSTTFEESSQETKNRFLKSINTIAESSIDDLEYLDGTQFGLHKTSVGCEEKNDGWTGIVDDGEKFKKAEETDKQVASIELDKSKLCNKATGQSRAVYFVIFRNSRLFTQSNEKRTQSFAVTGHETTSTFDRCKMNFHETNGLVLSSVILDGNQTESVNARMKFKKDQNASSLPSHSNLAVTWWDQTEWSTERQCKMHEENGEFVAHCDHLTNFALLIQRSSTDPMLCSTFLDKLSFWLLLASATCLCILFTIYFTRIVPVVKDNILIRMLNNTYRPTADSFIVFYVCVMLLFYLIFIVLIDQSTTGSRLVCKLTAAVLYNLFLTALIVNIFQAWNLIRVCAWSSRMEFVLGIMTWRLIAFPVAFGLPIVVCVTVWFIDHNFFYRGDEYCWIQPKSVIFAVLIPVTIMLINSAVTFVIFCFRMFPSCFRLCGSASTAVRLSTGTSKHKIREALQLLIAVLFAQFLLGFPWLLQYPAMFSSKITVWHYLFAVLNGSNGIILLFMYICGRAMAFYETTIVSNSRSTDSTANH
ncbi:hypothetical protein M3Y95_00397700 [Aphelenchoides besseyi]|nr:hypothetical protein M3Y95_00397700 [Aphelenchoides besseyi]